jgi:hypothetical protein
VDDEALLLFFYLSCYAKEHILKNNREENKSEKYVLIIMCHVADESFRKCENIIKKVLKCIIGRGILLNESKSFINKTMFNVRDLEIYPYVILSV